MNLQHPHEPASIDISDHLEALIRAADETQLHKPMRTSKLSKLNPAQRKVLRAWYRSKDVPSRAIASLLNALATQQLGCFLIARQLFLDLIKDDPNQTNPPGLTHDGDLRAVTAKLVRNGFRVVSEQRGRAASIIEVVSPVMIALLGLSNTQIREQKVACMALRESFDESTGKRIKIKKKNFPVDNDGCDHQTPKLDTAFDTATDTMQGTRHEVPSTKDHRPNAQIPVAIHEWPEAASDGSLREVLLEGVSETDATKEHRTNINFGGLASSIKPSNSSSELSGRAAEGGLERRVAERIPHTPTTPLNAAGSEPVGEREARVPRVEYSSQNDSAKLPAVNYSEKALASVDFLLSYTGGGDRLVKKTTPLQIVWFGPYGSKTPVAFLKLTKSGYWLWAGTAEKLAAIKSDVYHGLHNFGLKYDSVAKRRGEDATYEIRFTVTNAEWVVRQDPTPEARTADQEPSPSIDSIASNYALLEDGHAQSDFSSERAEDQPVERCGIESILDESVPSTTSNLPFDTGDELPEIETNPQRLKWSTFNPLSRGGTFDLLSTFLRSSGFPMEKYLVDYEFNGNAVDVHGGESPWDFSKNFRVSLHFSKRTDGLIKFRVYLSHRAGPPLDPLVQCIQQGLQGAFGLAVDGQPTVEQEGDGIEISVCMKAPKKAVA